MGDISGAADAAVLENLHDVLHSVSAWLRFARLKDLEPRLFYPLGSLDFALRIQPA
ncbi:MAG: hypothetical protein WB037_00980 [Pseudolabrys sp.]